MIEPEFPPDLIERCALAAFHTDYGEDLEPSFQDDYMRIAKAVLRESGHAELVAALAKSRAWLGAGTPPDVFHEIDAALKTAGAL